MNVDGGVVTAVAGVVAAGVGWFGRVALELAKAAQSRRGGTITPQRPPPMAEPSLTEKVNEVHDVVTARDANLLYRVWNKPDVEDAILETARNTERIVALLETQQAIIRKRLPSVND